MLGDLLVLRQRPQLLKAECDRVVDQAVDSQPVVDPLLLAQREVPRLPEYTALFEGGLHTLEALEAAAVLLTVVPSVKNKNRRA